MEKEVRGFKVADAEDEITRETFSLWVNQDTMEPIVEFEDGTSVSVKWGQIIEKAQKTRAIHDAKTEGEKQND